MLETLQSVLNLMNPPTHPNVGEVYLLHQELSAYYYLRVKSHLYEGHCQSSDLKQWWADARDRLDGRIQEITDLMNNLGIPLPASLPAVTELDDQFMALDAMAMMKGLMNADVIALQSVRHPEAAALFHRMFDGALTYLAKIVAIAEREGWSVQVPPYQGGPPHPGDKH